MLPLMRRSSAALVLSLLMLGFAPSSEAARESGIQGTPDGKRILVNKDVGNSRYAIEQDQDDRSATGNVFFSMKALMSSNNELATALRNGPYAQPSIVPASTWLDNKPPSRPSVRAKRDSSSDAVTVNWSTGWFGEKPWQWAVWAKYGDEWRFFVYPSDANGVTLDPDAKLGKVTAMCVSAVDRCGNESERVQVACH